MKKRILTMCLCLLVAGCLLFAGCTPEERIAAYKEALVAAQDLSAQADDYIAAGEVVIRDIEAALADPNVPVEDVLKLREKLASLTVGIAKAKVEKARVDKIIVSTLAKIDNLENHDFWGEVALFSKTAIEISPQIPAPIGPIVWIVGVVGSALAANMKQKKKGDKELAGVVKSVDDVIAEARLAKALEPQAILDILKRQKPEIREAVRRIKAA